MTDDVGRGGSALALALAQRSADYLTASYRADGVTVADAAAMPFGGERNCALRAALGLEPGEIGMVNQGDVVQVVVAGHGRANGLARDLKGGLGGGWTVRTNRRPDGRFIVTAFRR